MRTDLRSVEVLLAVEEHGSIGAAARALGMSQPSVTERLARLERHLGLTLLHRSPRGTTLTDHGITVANWAREVVAASDRLEVGVAALRSSGGSRVRVSASMTVAEYLMPRWLVELRARSPRTNVVLRVCNSEQVAHDLLGGLADVGFVEGLGRVRGLRERRVASDHLILIVEPGHPWTRRRRTITSAELASAPVILRESGSGTRQALVHALRQAGHTLEPMMELGSTAAVRAAVVAGQGVAVISALAAEDDIAAGRLATVPFEIPLIRQLRLVWRSGTALTGVAAELATIASASSRLRLN